MSHVAAAVDVASAIAAQGLNPAVLQLNGYTCGSIVGHPTLADAKQDAAMRRAVLLDPAFPHHVWFLAQDTLVHMEAFPTQEEAITYAMGQHVVMLVTGPAEAGAAHIYAMNL